MKITLIGNAGDFIQALVRGLRLADTFISRSIPHQDHCTTDDMSIIATGVSELGINTTVKIWKKSVEEAAPEELPPPGPRGVEGPSKVLSCSRVVRILLMLSPASLPPTCCHSDPGTFHRNSLPSVLGVGWDTGGIEGKIRGTTQCLEEQRGLTS